MLKPKSCYGKDPEDAVTTHPVLVEEALCRQIIAAGGHPGFTESQGPLNVTLLKRICRRERAWRKRQNDRGQN